MNSKAPATAPIGAASSKEPSLSKSVLSQFLAKGCHRLLYLSLHRSDKATKLAEGHPEQWVHRPGLRLIKQRGEEWESHAMLSLQAAVGSILIGTTYVNKEGLTVFTNANLATQLAQAGTHAVIPQGTFDADPAAFFARLGAPQLHHQHNLQISDSRPDIIEVMPPGSATEEVRPDASRAPVAANDPRRVIRVIDVKLSSDPLPGHFAEVVLYSIALSNWLHDKGLDKQFIVSDKAAIWAGDQLPEPWQKTIEAAKQGTIKPEEALQQFHVLLNEAHYGVYAGRIMTFIQRELPQVLGTHDWKDLPYHVHGACRNCEYLGPTNLTHSKYGVTANDDQLCFPKATTDDHLSQIAFLSRGARAALERSGCKTVTALAAAPASSLETHQDLLAQRAIIPARAQVLATHSPAHIPANAGTSVDVPRMPELRLYVSTDADPSSHTSLHFTFNGYHYGNGNGTPIPRQTFPVPVKTAIAEQNAFASFLDALETELDRWYQQESETRVQFYMWDPSQHEQLERVITRHFAFLLGSGRLAKVSWAFPPEQRIPNAEIESTGNAILVVKDPVRALLAAPVKHYYKLEEVATDFYPANQPFSYKPDYEWDDPMSDGVPPERCLELWAAPLNGPKRQNLMQGLETLLERRHRALDKVVRALYAQLQGKLTSLAPRISELRRQVNRQNWSDLTRALFWFEKLEVALEELDTERTHAMSLNEREAKHKSAVLQQQLKGTAESSALAQFGLTAQIGRRVYKLASHSRHARFEDGQGFAIIQPAPGTPGMERLRRRRLLGANGILPQWLQATLPSGRGQGLRGKDVLGVEVVRIDNINGVVILDENTWAAQSLQSGDLTLTSLEAAGLITGLDAGASLDPLPKDFRIPRLEWLFDNLKRPPIATRDPLLRQALGLGGTNETPNTTNNPPLAELLWGGTALAQASHTPWPGYAAATALGTTALNASQQAALTAALTRRLTLVWGPPGTGKTRTLAHIIAAYAKDALANNKAARILITANGYTAIDNLLEDCQEQLSALGIQGARIWRLRSGHADPNPRLPASADIVPNASAGPLLQHLPKGVNIVGGTPQQIHQLATKDLHDVLAPTWNLAIVDEASQITVADASLALSALAPGAATVVAGDQKQLDPIRQAEAPLGLEHVVGSFLDYLRVGKGIKPAELLVNYRSNTEIVAIQHRAGYPSGLHAWSPTQRLRLTAQPPSSQPANWPPELTWSSAWKTLLDPAKPVACFTYDDAVSSQWNEFEAHAMAALVRTLAQQQPLVADAPDNRLDQNGHASPQPASCTPYTWDGFWTKGVGLVTPHRAQRSLIVSRLAQAFDAELKAGAFDRSLINDAVDTVERFQGQERDVILVSYCVGDPDLVLREDEFLMSFNRFNVAASRPRCKLLLFVSNGVAHHVSQDLEVVEESRLIKEFVDAVCSKANPMTLPAPAAYGQVLVNGTWRTS